MKLNGSWQVRLAQVLLGAALVIGLVVVSGTNAETLTGCYGRLFLEMLATLVGSPLGSPCQSSMTSSHEQKARTGALSGDDAECALEHMIVK